MNLKPMYFISIYRVLSKNTKKFNAFNANIHVTWIFYSMAVTWTVASWIFPENVKDVKEFSTYPAFLLHTCSVQVLSSVFKAILNFVAFYAVLRLFLVFIENQYSPEILFWCCIKSKKTRSFVIVKFVKCKNYRKLILYFCREKSHELCRKLDNN